MPRSAREGPVTVGVQGDDAELHDGLVGSIEAVLRAYGSILSRLFPTNFSKLIGASDQKQLRFGQHIPHEPIPHSDLGLPLVLSLP
jgi:hypothetical protein